MQLFCDLDRHRHAPGRDAHHHDTSAPEFLKHAREHLACRGPIVKYPEPIAQFWKVKEFGLIP
jgi:hypothetical protein